MPNYLDVANSGFMFVLCLIPVVVIVAQAVRFMLMAWKRGLEIGMDKEKLKKCITTSISISIVPAFSLVTLLIALAPQIGKFFPWLRLSNIGAGGYEAIAAGIAMEASGAAEWAQLTLLGFVTVMLTMNLGMSVAPVVTLFSLKKYDKTLKKAKASNPFIMIGTAAAFTAVIARLAVPYYTNFSNKLAVISSITGTIVMYVCVKMKKKVPFLNDFSLSLALIAGAVVCIIVAAAGLV